MLSQLLPENVYKAILKLDVKKVTEIRLRSDKPIKVSYGNSFCMLKENSKDIICSSDLIKEVLLRATEHSLYSYIEQLKKGYISAKGGVRIGVCGSVIGENEKIMTLDKISSLNIRIPHQIKGVAKQVFKDELSLSNYLICGKPHSGKTTLIRDMLRELSLLNFNCLAVDERGELAAVYNTTPTLDVGNNCDVLCGIKSGQAVEMAIKNMNPDILFLDELYTDLEVNTAIKAIMSGVKVVTSVHAGSINDVRHNQTVFPLLKQIDKLVLLDIKHNATLYSKKEINEFVNSE